MGVAAMTFVACDGPLVSEELKFEPLQGEWIACLNDGAGDYTKHLLFYPDSFASTSRTYTTTDRTCAGAETGVSYEIWRYRLTAEASARIGTDGPEVLAKAMSIENSFVTVFTIVYVDGQASPASLYFGDLTLDPLRDGTTPEKRPNVLSAATVFTER